MSEASGPADRSAEASRRVRVTAPRSSARPAPAPAPLSRELAEQSELGAALLRSLVRSQLRLAIGVAAAFLLSILALALASELAATLPWLPGIPLSWLILGVLPYPAAVACGVFYLRASARNEQRFRELLRERR